MDENTIYILDSTAFLEKYAQQFRNMPCATVYEVLDEVIEPNAKIQLDMFIAEGLEIINPSKDHVDEVEKVSQKTKDKASPADKKLIALALELKSKGRKCTIVTDDYAIQNIASLLGIDTLAVSQQKIRKTLLWLRKCTACGRKSEKAVCDFCGSETKYYSREVG